MLFLESLNFVLLGLSKGFNLFKGGLPLRHDFLLTSMIYKGELFLPPPKYCFPHIINILFFSIFLKLLLQTNYNYYYKHAKELLQKHFPAWRGKFRRNDDTGGGYGAKVVGCLA
jgi:hypothetical protein